MSKTLVRVTQEPGVVREVDEAEFTDLSLMGLIHSHNRGDGSSPEKWVGKKKGEDVIVQSPTITDPPADADAAPDTKGA